MTRSRWRLRSALWGRGRSDYSLPSTSPTAACGPSAALLSVLVSVLCSAGCCSLLRRLSDLQSHCDRFDVEAVRVVSEMMASGGQSQQQIDDALWPSAQHAREAMGAHIVQRLATITHTSHQQHHTPHCARHSPSGSTDSGQQQQQQSVSEWAAHLSHSARCDVLRDYLIAHTLKDCSIIIDIAAIQHTESLSSHSQLPVYAWQTKLDGVCELRGVYSMQVIDVDCKLACNIPRYAQLDVDIATLYANNQSQLLR